mgnify:CR=1 FL=1
MKKVFGTILACAIVTTSASPVLADAPLLTAATSAPNYTVVINGDKIDADGIYTEGKQIMLPLRSVAEKLGYKVTWDEAKQGITLDNGEVNTTVYIGEDNYYMASSTAIGMSAPTALGAAPVLKGDKTYVPAEMFSVLNCGKVYTVADRVITFGDANKADSKDESVQIPNPFTEYESIELAEKAVAFDVKLPSYIPDGFSFDYASTMRNDFIQIGYKNADGAEILYRMAKGSDDISGDYNIYDSVKAVKVNGIDVTLRTGSKTSVDGEDSASAIWTDGGYSFSVYCSNVGSIDVDAVIKGIK